jgi:hypothetical protein
MPNALRPPGGTRIIEWRDSSLGWIKSRKVITVCGVNHEHRILFLVLRKWPPEYLRRIYL